MPGYIFPFLIFILNIYIIYISFFTQSLAGYCIIHRLLSDQGDCHTLCIGDRGAARTFFGFLLTPGRNALSAALHCLAAIAQLDNLVQGVCRNTAAAAALLSVRAETFEYDSLLTTPQLVMTYKVSVFDSRF